MSLLDSASSSSFPPSRAAVSGRDRVCGAQCGRDALGACRTDRQAVEIAQDGSRVGDCLDCDLAEFVPTKFHRLVSLAGFCSGHVDHNRRQESSQLFRAMDRLGSGLAHARAITRWPRSRLPRITQDARTEASPKFLVAYVRASRPETSLISGNLANSGYSESEARRSV
jgi:hypothetical protein